MGKQVATYMYSGLSMSKLRKHGPEKPGAELHSIIFLGLTNSHIGNCHYLCCAQPIAMGLDKFATSRITKECDYFS